MPSLVRKLLVIATLDGLVLQPLGPRNQRIGHATKIDYRSYEIASLQDTFRDGDTQLVSFKAYGIVGLLTVSSSSYLISICRRHEVARIRGKPIYAVTDVTLTPLSSQADAEKAIRETAETVEKYERGADVRDEPLSEDEDSQSYTSGEKDDLDTPFNERTDRKADEEGASQTSVAAEVFQQKGAYGWFANRWISRRGWRYSVTKQGMTNAEGSSNEAAPPDKQGSEGAVAGSVAGAHESVNATTNTLERPVTEPHTGKTTDESVVEAPDSVVSSAALKILRTTKTFFGSQNFFFSYDYDISRKYPAYLSKNEPLSKQFSPLFFWNQHLQTPFIEAGQQNLVLPLIHGFVGQKPFSASMAESSSKGDKPDAQAKSKETGQVIGGVPAGRTEDFLLTLISRRSVKRAGLRYLRRGVDDGGNVANSVESEQILSSASWNSAKKVYSFVQVRGSIPLYFSQTPYTFKPVPVFHASAEANQRALKQHFRNLVQRYGGVQVTNLLDKHGNEVKLGEAYEENLKALNDNGGINGKKISFEWFDFHSECRGMKFENVSRLIDTLGPKMKSFTWSVQQHGKAVQSQSGVLRTNCMDCLDRTNVVQSACARVALEAQLADQSIPIDLQSDPSTSWFNLLWADNGDALSKQYSGAAALKGDYTRTRKRHLTGALTDFGLTLSRYYNNIVNDYFTQACIDYYLGGVTDAVFEDFEADLMSADPAVDLARLRQNAIAMCSKIVIEDSAEEVVGVWTLLAPHEPNTLRALPFEEVVLLLTDAALYKCSVDWNTEKVAAFERVGLDTLEGLFWGAYVTATNHSSLMDESRNVGLVVRYRGGGNVVRVNTRSLDSEKEDGAEGEHGKRKASGKAEESRIMALKALPARSARVSERGVKQQQRSERELVNDICREIERAVKRWRGEGRDEQGEGTVENNESRTKALKVEEKDIISATEAKRRTGYLETLGYSVKRMIWG